MNRRGVQGAASTVECRPSRNEPKPDAVVSMFFWLRQFFAKQLPLSFSFDASRVGDGQRMFGYVYSPDGFGGWIANNKLTGTLGVATLSHHVETPRSVVGTSQCDIEPATPFRGYRAVPITTDKSVVAKCFRENIHCGSFLVWSCKELSLAGHVRDYITSATITWPYSQNRAGQHGRRSLEPTREWLLRKPTHKIITRRQSCA